ncbi:MAG TPA: tRNA dihydrouridine synthase DusB [Syntrophales bacterium]|nr:tRNA dihydrouridine synthase DusB [Syntrophales bacterium]
MRIGKLLLNNHLSLAPMAGITNTVFRSTAREFGCALAFTEMISAEGLVRGNYRTEEYLRRIPPDYPLGVQLFGSDAAAFAEAARIAEARGADLIDVNMGCPAKKVLRTGGGALLMKDPAKVRSIIKAIRNAVSLPLTIKLRSGWGRPNAGEIAAIAEDCGVDAVILHPRTPEQGFSGKPDWSLIEKLKKSLRIPVIGNGDVKSAPDAVRMQETTGCDGVMIGRASMGNPWIFRQVLNYGDKGSRMPDIEEKRRVLMYNINMIMELFERKTAVLLTKQNISWYVRGLPGSSAFRCEVSGAAGAQEIRSLIAKYFAKLAAPEAK